MDHISTILWAMSKGLMDSLRGTLVLFSIDNSVKEKSKQQEITQRIKNSQSRRLSSQAKASKSERPKILWLTVQCCVLNGGVFLASMLIFEMLLLPTMQILFDRLVGDTSSTGSNAWFWMKTILSWTFDALWVLPLFLLSKILNSLWFLDIAAIVYKHCCERPQASSGFSQVISDAAFSVIVQVLFLLQATVVSYLPTPVATILSALHMTMLYSLYSFEYKWMNKGWQLYRRLTFIEYNWPYFVGFGLPLHILTLFADSYVVSGCFFSMAFPLFIVSGTKATPITGVPPDFPLQLFSPVVAFCNGISSLLSYFFPWRPRLQVR